jgi:hypothetical protein
VTIGEAGGEQDVCGREREGRGAEALVRAAVSRMLGAVAAAYKAPVQLLKHAVPLSHACPQMRFQAAAGTTAQARRHSRHGMVMKPARCGGRGRSTRRASACVRAPSTPPAQVQVGAASTPAARALRREGKREQLPRPLGLPCWIVFLFFASHNLL